MTTTSYSMYFFLYKVDRLIDCDNIYTCNIILEATLIAVYTTCGGNGGSCSFCDLEFAMKSVSACSDGTGDRRC